MRTYTPFKLPRGLKARLVQALNDWTQRHHGEPWNKVDACWHQSLVCELLPAEEYQQLRDILVQRLSQATGTPFNPEHFSTVLHWGYGEVPPHRDDMAKTCFLVPLVASPTLTFYVEYQGKVRLRQVPVVRFNDYDRHGIDNPFAGRYLLLTLTRDLIN